jgi:hypothetical protein
MTNLHSTYVETMSQVLKANPGLMSPIPPADDASMTMVKAGEEKVGARKTFEVEFQNPSAGEVVFSFHIPGGNTEFELIKCAPAGGGDAQHIMPKRTYKRLQKRIKIGAGVFTLKWKPAGLLKSSMLHYSVSRLNIA